MDYSPPGSSVHGILQARILECIAIFFSRRSSQPRDRTYVSCIGRRILYHWATELNLAIPLCNPQSTRGFRAATSNLSFGHVTPGPWINSSLSFLGILESLTTHLPSQLRNLLTASPMGQTCFKSFPCSTGWSANMPGMQWVWDQPLLVWSLTAAKGELR